MAIHREPFISDGEPKFSLRDGHRDVGFTFGPLGVVGRRGMAIGTMAATFLPIIRDKHCPFGQSNYLHDMMIKAIIHKAEEGGFWAEVPALPGCVTQGETEAEIEASLHEAIALWLEAGEPEPCHNQEDKIVELTV